MLIAWRQIGRWPTPPAYEIGQLRFSRRSNARQRFRARKIPYFWPGLERSQPIAYFLSSRYLAHAFGRARDAPPPIYLLIARKRDRPVMPEEDLAAHTSHIITGRSNERAAVEAY